MDFLVDIEVAEREEKDESLLIGAWEDLEYLTSVLNNAWESYEYRLELVPGGNDFYLFVEDPIKEDEYECGIIEKRGEYAYAFSEAVHNMVMNAYLKYVEEFGELE